ncbi:MAG: hypothetical protein OQK11_02650 [Thiovulaceae bacterium]|nr:hypothetical protein [Sulfurimonadaceae bacterium]
MKLIILISTLCVALAANPLKDLANNFSKIEKLSLLEELNTSSSSLYKSKTYNLSKGWNILTTPKDGVDVVKTFQNTSEISYIVTYDYVSKIWAAYSPNKSFTDMLFLKYLEPNVTFFVLANKDVALEIKSNTANDTCKKFMEDKNYEFLVDSGISKDYETSNDKKISLQSRYFSHHEKGIYNDTRILLVYPKIVSNQKQTLKYGPGNPKIAIKFTKAFEGKNFYVYDFKQTKCFEGLFPSRKIPPFATLKEVK